MAIKLREILEAIPSLTPAELQRVKKVIAALDALTTVRQEAIETYPDDWVTDGVVYELKRRGLVSSGLPRTRLYQQGPVGYQGRSQDIQQLLLGKCARHLTAAEKLFLGRVAARALADFCETAFQHVGLRIMLQQVDTIPEALDCAYPGYLAAGMVDFLIKQGKA